MTFIDQFSLALDPNFQNRVKIALVTAAINVTSESKSSDSGVTGPSDDAVYQKRLSWAFSVITNPDNHLNAMVWAVAANAAITSVSLDSDIQFTVNSMVSAFAGVTADD